MELMMLNRRLTAEEALDWGIVNEVVDDEELSTRTRELAEQLASGATLAFGAVKRLLHESLSGTLETQMEREAREIAALARSGDGQEGVQAFLEKRSPAFRGR